MKFEEKLLGGKMLLRCVVTKCFRNIPTKLEKLRLQHNWKYGIYNERSLFYVRRKYMPWLKLENESVWLSRGSKIYNYTRNPKNIINTKPKLVLSPQYRQSCVNVGFASFDVTKFAIRNNILIAGLSDGGVYAQNLEDKNDSFIDKVEDTYTSSVDISSDGLTVASGARSDCFRIFSVHRNPLELSLIHTQEMGERAWCVSFCQDSSVLACATSATRGDHKSISLYDTERYVELIAFRLTHSNSATMDVKWNGPHVLWSCGNDSYIRRWDTRTGRCEQKFHDAFGSGLYCLDHDYCNSIIVGTQLHGRTALWDVRTQRCVQLYFSRTSKRNPIYSPVYSISFDSEYLFAALDQNLNIMDFRVYDLPKMDYVEMLCWVD